MLPSRQELLRMRLESLRLVVQSFLGLEDWPGDWTVAGQILEQSYFNFQRARSGAELYGITLFGAQVNGTGIDEDPLVAIFRAYVLMRFEEAELDGSS
ncbi:MAG: hypothetical protein IH586_11990 [Anaerolineaceae bacterium]|nr:hypothetical protein [Anaerolineaceae bacterium]